MNFSRAAIAAYVGLIFASGAVLGAFGTRLYTASREASKPGPRPNPEELAQIVDRYVARLEHYCRIAPYNWFNFYDVWH